MLNYERRGLIAGGTTLIFGGALASLASVGAEDDETNGSEDDTNGSEDDPNGSEDDPNDGENERMDESEPQPDENEVDAEDADEDDLEMSVSATDSTPVTEGHADFLVTVTNDGDEPVSVPVTLEIAHVYKELEVLELDPGESGDAYASFEARDFGSGDHEWTVTAGDAVETGTVTVESEDDYDEDRADIELTVHLQDGATVRIQEGDTMRIGCNLTVFNHGDEPVSATGSLEIADQTKPIAVELDGRESEHISKTVEIGEGEHEWTITVEDESESGTLTAVCDSE